MNYYRQCWRCLHLPGALRKKTCLVFVSMYVVGEMIWGSQKTPDFPNETIQGIIESALKSLNPSNIPLSSFASRTDKGVHALVNTFHVDLVHNIPGKVFKPHVVTKHLNSYLKNNNHEILVTSTCVVPNIFHARHNAKWRCYIYRLAILKPEINAGFSSKGTYEEYLPISEVNRCHIV
ncbi:tRNA pseudouridine synthase-like 1, partial [Stegodyphus mimosarum]